ncbi:hypothetical protein [Hymenobacter psychrotolerans]|uniref:DUF3298 domain-containing protein n=1 Tax=Hymenobacter psychrotolerans DSM 18569 TaxID=1121959 RepID=A0A1M6RKE4_9BACT|nr:hypothetical protein [Hymenobacter psychrotolerans]SHK32961.1 hypothetical protein SAMN02746009_00736 [Hymenobacter psychrotolerans DSM 18569]
MHTIRYGLTLAAGLLLAGRPAVAQGPAANNDPLTGVFSNVQRLVGTYEGTLNGKYRIRLQLSGQDSALTGQYYYLSKGQLLQLRGQLHRNGLVLLRETVGADTVATGWFSGKLDAGPLLADQWLRGEWYNRSGTTLMPFQLQRVDGSSKPTTAKARIGSKTYLSSFEGPIVTVPDAGVTKLLAQWFSLENLIGQDLTSLRAEQKYKRQEGMSGGTEELDYTVNYNAHGLLSITAQTTGTGASVWYDHRTQNIDLNTGFPVVLEDEIQPEKLTQFLALGQQKLQKITRTYKQDEFLSEEDEQGVLGQQFGLHSTREYTVSAAGLMCDHPVSYDGLSNFVWKVLTGNFQVEFSHAELARFLKPESPLRRLAAR